MFINTGGLGQTESVTMSLNCVPEKRKQDYDHALVFNGIFLGERVHVIF